MSDRNMDEDVKMVGAAPFGLPLGWTVEERPLPNSTQVDRKYIMTATGQQFGSVRAVERFLSDENACTATPATPESIVKSVPLKQRACGTRSDQKNKHTSVAEEDKSTLKLSKHIIESLHSKKPDSEKKTMLEEDNRASVHNLTEPPPAKVSWVLSSPGGFWSPFVNDSIVSESERLKWSEAFVQSIND
ncbi:hypothetical protein Fmac_019690 [Flemingia macrophylla]|uniref:Uncharacterized protein n=1 Tax=Flemingia macrophylla TaxID=520843 RepID=A0ABD1M8H8_9FABA